MKENNVMKILIPIVAVLIIWESVMLVSSLKKEKVVQVSDQVATESAVVKEAVKPVAFDIIFGTEKKEMKVGSVYPVEVTVVGKDNYNLDSIALYVKYDPLAFELSSLVGGEKLPKPTFSKISVTNGIAVVNYLISEPTGFAVKKDDVVSVLKFNVKPKKVGNFDFEITTGNESKTSVTMFVENATSEVLPFSSNKLNVNVLK